MMMGSNGEEPPLTRHFINKSDKVVIESLRGLAIARPDLRVDFENKFVYRAERGKGVALISGGGSGHEPAHVGYVGKGMLSAAVCGNIYASPTATQVYRCIRQVAFPTEENSTYRQVLLIVKNYTGDRWQFGRAMERARQDGLQVEMVIVDDDQSLPKNASKAGRRGLAGTVFVHKILGAAAENGESLMKLVSLARDLIPRIGTIGVSLTSCNIPGRVMEKADPYDDPWTTENNQPIMSYGLGIHGEPGFKKEPLQNAHEISKLVGSAFVKDLNGYFGGFTNDVIVLVNNLGTTTAMEIYLFAGQLAEYFKSAKVSIDRLLVGTFMTALDMHGISVTVLNCTGIEEDVKRLYLDLLDAKTEAFGWNWNLASQSPNYIPEFMEKSDSPKPQNSNSKNQINNHSKVIIDAVYKVSKHLFSLINYLNELDSKVGDGDTGTTVGFGVEALLSWIEKSEMRSSSSPSLIFQEMAMELETKMGGSSGAFFCLLMESMSRAYQKCNEGEMTGKEILSIWLVGLENGVECVSKYGGAKLGDRTMLDALVPAIDVLRNHLKTNNHGGNIISEMYDAANIGAKQTAKLVKAAVGRSSYVSGNDLLGHPDPGAICISEIFKVLSQG